MHTCIHTYIPSFHTPSFFVTQHLSHTTLSHTTVFTSRSFTTSFVFPSFPVPLQHLLLIIGRSWHVVLSGPLINILTSKCALFEHLNFQKCSNTEVFCNVLYMFLPHVLGATIGCNFQKWSEHVRTWCALNFLTWKRASRHNGVHFFIISTSKSGPNLVCFVHLDFEMCFAPQRHVIFHLSSPQMAPHPPL